jgi:hypothetical protein
MYKQIGNRVRQWDGLGTMANLIEARALFAKIAGELYPGGVAWRIPGYYTGSIPTSWCEIGPGNSTPRTWPTASSTISCVSSSASDTGAGLVVTYLDANWHERSAVFVLNGTTPVTLAAGLGTGDTAGQTVTAWRVNDVRYLGTNVGTISISIGANVQTRVEPGHSDAHMMAYTIPRGQRLITSSYEVHVDLSKVISMRIVGARINTSTGARLEVVRNQSAEASGFTGQDYRPELIETATETGIAAFGPIDLAFLIKASSSTTGTVSGIARGVRVLDEAAPDTDPSKIPWVATEIQRLDAQGWPR